jgi:uncharacterized protein YkwD
MKYIFFSFLIVSLFTNCSSEDDVNAKNYSIQSYNHRADEIELINIIDDYRISIGLNRLEIIDHVSYMSSYHNNYMIQNKVVSHDFFIDRSDEIVSLFNAKIVGENIAFNFISNHSVLSAWLSSPGHKAIIEGDFTHMGLSITIDPTNGKKYYTNIFVKL